MHKLRFYVSCYAPKAPYVLVYMLQQVEYTPAYFREWIGRGPNVLRVMKRQRLVLTKKALLLLIASYGVWLIGLVSAVLLLINNQILSGVLLLVFLPAILVSALSIICLFGYVFLQAACQKLFREATTTMEQHQGVKVAVLGSYGKTTMKEVLATVLGEAKNVAVTPGNKNVAVSHARWIQNHLTGQEDIVLFEYGEFRPGDIKQLASITKPDMAVICGVAPNHLENFPFYDDLKAELRSIQFFVKPEQLFADAATGSALDLTDKEYMSYDSHNVLGWKIEGAKTDLDGTKFKLLKGKKVLRLHSGLVGEHLVLPLAFAAALAESLGMKDEDIERGIAKTKPFEHRMQPYRLGGAWVIDDTYNGNIDGMRAGLRLLTLLEAKRKIYVTPGLVEQGVVTEQVHAELGRSIAKAAPDQVVLMQNSVQPLITASLEAEGYKGELKIIDDPLSYYKNLQYEIAHGDLVLMQNDWTDNYN